MARLVEGEELAVGREERGQPVEVHVDLAAVPDVACLGEPRSRLGKRGPRRLGDRHHRELLGELLDGAGLVEGERADGRAAQRREVAAHAELGAEVAGDGPDVGAARAADRDVDVEPVAGCVRTPWTSSSWMVTGRAGSSTSSPSRTRW